MGVVLGVEFSVMILDLVVVPPLAVVVAVIAVLLLVTLQLFGLSIIMDMLATHYKIHHSIKPPLSQSYHLFFLLLIQVQIPYSLESLH